MNLFYLVLPTLLILFCSALIRQITGFGHALLAIPLLTLVAGIRIASPLVTMTGAVIGLIATLTQWQAVDRETLWRLVVASVVGIPLGIWLFTYAPDALVLQMLGVFLIGYSVYCLVTPQLPLIQPGASTWFFGFIAGILGGAYNTSGPPIVIYAALRRWSPVRFRATLQPYFFVTSLIAAIGHYWAGFWTPTVLWLFVYALPGVLIGMFLGERINLAIPKEMFNRVIYGFLILTGVLLLVN